MIPGIYSWSYSKGSFPVEIRTYNNVFYCSQYAAGGSTWSFEGDRLKVNWKKFGDYEFELKSSEPVKFEGYAVNDKANWRIMEFVRPYTPEELIVQGEYGAGSAWNFEYEGGSFEIQFLFDSYNHFVCPSYPAHSHWSMSEGRVIDIDWGKFGKYQLQVDSATASMTGSKLGQPSNWRKASLIRSINPVDLEASAHAHAHDH
jgi:hypothetical protein